MKRLVAPFFLSLGLIFVSVFYIAELSKVSAAATVPSRALSTSTLPQGRPADSQISNRPQTRAASSTHPVIPPNPPISSNSSTAKGDINLNSNSCFDYYHFGSVAVNIDSRSAKIAINSDIDLTGNIANSNSYPIVDGSVYIKVYKNGNHFNQTTGGYLVDEFFASSSVTVAGNSSIPFDFKWHVPSNSESGDYSIVTYFVKDDSNLSGLTFTDDIQGISYDFQITGGRDNVIEFNKSKTTLNGAIYKYVAFPPDIDKNKPAQIVVPIANTTGAAEEVSVAWNVYSWDGLSDSRLISTSTANVFVPPGGASTTIYITDTQHPVYFANATLSYKDSKSIVGIRFVRNDVSQIRLEDPSLISFPIQANTESALFTCLHSMGVQDQVSGARLALSLTDRYGNVLASSTYNGLVTGSMMLRKILFTPHQNYDYAVLSAKLYLNNVLEDQYSITYDCKAIDPTKCNAPFSFNLGTLLILVLAIGLIAFGVYMKRGRRGGKGLKK